MPSSLVNSYSGTNVHFNEYSVTFNTEPIPGSVILIGYDYLSHDIIAEYNGQQIIVGQVPIGYFSANDNFRLVITLEITGTNTTPIPYTVFFDFAEDGTVLGSADRNPFLAVLPRPVVNMNLSSTSFDDNVDMTITWTSDATDHVEIVITNVDGIIVYSDFSAPVNGSYIFNGLTLNSFADKNPFTVNMTAFNEPLISTNTSDTFDLLVTDRTYDTNSINNNNSVGSPTGILLDLLPYIITADINVINDSTVELVYTTQDATFVDILSSFDQGALNLSPNGNFIFTNLQQGTVYSVTVMARDDESNIDVRTVLFELNESGVNRDRGFLGLKRGKDMTFSVSAGVYTKETDLSGVAEPFVGTNGCFAGKFKWGPCLERIRIANEETLGVIFGKPSTNADNAIDFFTAASYLSYSSALDVVRVASYNGIAYLNKNSTVSVKYNGLVSGTTVYSTPEAAITILNDNHYTNLLDADLENNTFIAKHTGDLGNSIGIAIAVNSTAVATGDEYKYSTDYIAKYAADNVVNAKYNKNAFFFSRSKRVTYVRPTVESTARSILDTNDWLSVDGQRYQVRSVTLGVDNAILYVTVTNGGSGYTVAPAVSFSAGAATATSTLATTGSIKSTVTITAPGSGYTNADGTYALTFTDGGGTGAAGTVTITSGAVSAVTISNGGTGYTSAPTLSFAGTGTFVPAVLTPTIGYAVASVTVTGGGSGYTTAPSVSFTGNGSGASATAHVASADFIDLDRLYTGVVSTGSYQTNTISNSSISELTKYWVYSNAVGLAPDSESLHVMVIDTLGKITGVPGSLLEKFANVSFDSAAKNSDGTTNYWLNRINTSSIYVRVGTSSLSEIPLFKSNTDTDAQSKDWIANLIYLVGGDDAFASMGMDDDIDAYDLFKSPEEADAPIIVGNYRSISNDGGQPNSVLANYLIQNIAEFRRDSVVFLSCRRESVVNNPKNEVREILKDVNTLPSTSYATMDSGWKYMYDKYNDRYWWIPTAGDHAGCYARTDRLLDPWYSAAGEKRGILNNVVKLAFNPNETQRDQLYPNRVNPVVTFPGIGTMIYGDKTLLSLSSSFNRIPTRRLFIVIEKTLANAARFALFEFNDASTRTQVYGIIDKYLRGVQGGRGIEDYAIDVSEKVNTPEVVALNQFKGRIYIKPKYSINFIELNFINVGALLSFDEAVSVLNNTV